MAIALHYDKENTPVVTAKGHDHLAEAIIDMAREHDIPLHEDNELCASLEQTKLGHEIPEELYLAIAEVIAFAYITTGKFPLDFNQTDIQQAHL